MSPNAIHQEVGREIEHANEYTEAWIEQVKRMGIYGLAVTEEYGGSPV